MSRITHCTASTVFYLKLNTNFFARFCGVYTPLSVCESTLFSQMNIMMNILATATRTLAVFRSGYVHARLVN